MTPDEWQTSTHALLMLEACEGRVSDAELRRLACACVRKMWTLLPKESRHALSVAEAFSAGNATRQELAAVHSYAVEGHLRVDRKISFKARKMYPPARAASVVLAVVSEDALDAARQAVKAFIDLYDEQPVKLLREVIDRPNDSLAKLKRTQRPLNE